MTRQRIACCLLVTGAANSGCQGQESQHLIEASAATLRVTLPDGTDLGPIETSPDYMEFQPLEGASCVLGRYLTADGGSLGTTLYWGDGTTQLADDFAIVYWQNGDGWTSVRSGSLAVATGSDGFRATLSDSTICTRPDMESEETCLPSTGDIAIDLVGDLEASPVAGATGTTATLVESGQAVCDRSDDAG